MQSYKPSNRNLFKKVATSAKLHSYYDPKDELISKVNEVYDKGDELFKENLSKLVKEYERINSHDITNIDEEISNGAKEIDIGFASTINDKSIELELSVNISNDGDESDANNNDEMEMVPLTAKIEDNNGENEDESYGEWINDERTNILLDELLDEPTSQML